MVDQALFDTCFAGLKKYDLYELTIFLFLQNYEVEDSVREFVKTNSIKKVFEVIRNFGATSTELEQRVTEQIILSLILILGAKGTLSF